MTDEELSYPSVVHFNGDDAIGLFHNDVLIDVIGVETEEGAWDVAGVQMVLRTISYEESYSYYRKYRLERIGRN